MRKELKITKSIVASFTKVQVNVIFITPTLMYEYANCDCGFRFFRAIGISWFNLYVGISYTSQDTSHTEQEIGGEDEGQNQKTES